MTDAEGQYSLPLLSVGNYKLDVTLSGFKNFVQTGILLEVGRNARVDAVIEPGRIRRSRLGRRRRAARGDQHRRAVTHRGAERGPEPAARQSRFLLAPLDHGRRDQQRQLQLLGGPEQLTTINGSQKAQIGTVSFQLDGGNNTAGLRGTGNPAPNPEAVQEFRVITNSYSAEYGRYPAGVVDVVTKSGSQRDPWRGLRVLPQREAERQAVGAAGRHVREGSARPKPVRRRRAVDRSGKDKTFFFASYSGLRQEETYYRNTAVVPTARERAGDFSQSAIKPRDPLTNAPFPATSFPPSRLDAAALTIQNQFVPPSNLANNFFEVRRPDPLDTDEATFKFDHYLSPTHSHRGRATST